MTMKMFSAVYRCCMTRLYDLEVSYHELTLPKLLIICRNVFFIRTNDLY